MIENLNKLVISDNQDSNIQDDLAKLHEIYKVFKNFLQADRNSDFSSMIKLDSQLFKMMQNLSLSQPEADYLLNCMYQVYQKENNSVITIIPESLDIDITKHVYEWNLDIPELVLSGKIINL